ncbi:MAG: hypothetical protein LBV17_11220, partial [Treponema sp.]|nr:hypothetical protein [Treponema sp.]
LGNSFFISPTGNALRGRSGEELHRTTSRIGFVLTSPSSIRWTYISDCNGIAYCVMVKRLVLTAILKSFVCRVQ